MANELYEQFVLFALGGNLTPREMVDLLRVFKKRKEQILSIFFDCLKNEKGAVDVLGNQIRSFIKDKTFIEVIIDFFKKCFTVFYTPIMLSSFAELHSDCKIDLNKFEKKNLDCPKLNREKEVGKQ